MTRDAAPAQGVGQGQGEARLPILIVGAGFAGAVIARELADSGRFDLTVIDRRDHIAGNAFDPVDPESGLRMHRYGPHIFHTSDQGIVDYLGRFTAWLPYTHCVEALVAGCGYVPLPINLTTLNRLYKLQLHDEAGMRAYLETVCTRHAPAANARQVLENQFGVELTELFFARYSRTMWGIPLDDLPAAVVSRLPVRYSDQRSYFNDTFQAMPAAGYLGLFQRLLDHPRITVRLGVAFEKRMERAYHHVFNSMPIDTYFDEVHGRLPYRSIRFENRVVEGHQQPVPTVNLTDGGAVTRITDWRLYPGCDRGAAAAQSGIRARTTAILTSEYPCSQEENGHERYYPVKTVDGEPQRIYQQYRRLAEGLAGVTFVGRCGQYTYFDMHQVVANSLMIAKRFLACASSTTLPS